MIETTTSRYQRSVAKHRGRLLDGYEKGALNGYWHDNRHRTLLKHDAAPIQKRVVEWSLAGWVGFLVVAALTFTGVRYVPLDPQDPSAGGFAGFALGVACCFGICWARNRWVEPARLEPYSAEGYALLGIIDDAAREIAKAADLGIRDADQLHAAAVGMRPGIEELLNEAGRLSAAMETSGGYVRADYRTVLADKADSLHRVLIDVAAELSAAAEVVFARREDLLVTHPEHDTPVELPPTVLTERGQEALAESRQLLASIAESSR